MAQNTNDPAHIDRIIAQGKALVQSMSAPAFDFYSTWVYTTIRQTKKRLAALTSPRQRPGR
jgi:hypothetical protein